MLFYSRILKSTNSKGASVFFDLNELNYFNRMFHAQKEIMKRVGFTEDVNKNSILEKRKKKKRSFWFIKKAEYLKDISLVFSLLSAILHLTNMKFSHDEETDGVYIEDEYPLEVGTWKVLSARRVRIFSYNFPNTKNCFKVSNLLAIEQEILATALISNLSLTRGEKVISLKNRDQANDCRDALAKALYERLFGWIVSHINDLLQSCYILKYLD